MKKDKTKKIALWIVVSILVLIPLIVLGVFIYNQFLGTLSIKDMVYVGEYNGKATYCYDSDGEDIYNKGKLNLYHEDLIPILESGSSNVKDFEDGFMIDYCQDEYSLGEQICVQSPEEVYYTAEGFDCPKGCKDGACLK